MQKIVMPCFDSFHSDDAFCALLPKGKANNSYSSHNHHLHKVVHLFVFAYLFLSLQNKYLEQEFFTTKREVSKCPAVGHGFK